MWGQRSSHHALYPIAFARAASNHHVVSGAKS
jgi:hypothetical protein